MEEGERRPLLGQDTLRLELAPSMKAPPPCSCLHPVPWKNYSGAWSCSYCPPGAEHPPRQGGFPGTPGNTWIKYLTLLSNLPFSLLGLLGLAAGLWGLALKDPGGNGWGCPLPTDLPLVLALGGLVVSAVYLAGVLGAQCESAGMLHCFSVSLLSLLVVEAIVGTLVVALWSRMQDNLDHTLLVAIDCYQDDPDLCFLLDWVQLGLGCCGVTSYQDWQRNPSFNCSSTEAQACSLPDSCCLRPPEDGPSVKAPCGSGALRLREAAAARVVHLEGCGTRLRGWLPRGACALGRGAAAVVVVQGAELVLAAWLRRALAER